MLNRTTHTWRVQLQREDGQTIEREVDVLWDPLKEGAMEAVMEAVRAEEAVPLLKQKIRVAALAAFLVEEPVAA